MLSDFNKRIEAIIKYSYDTLTKASEQIDASRAVLYNITTGATTRLNSNTLEKFKKAGFNTDWILNRVGNFANNKEIIYKHRLFLEKKLISTNQKKLNDLLFDFDKRKDELLDICQQYINDGDKNVVIDLLTALTRDSFRKPVEEVCLILKDIMDFGINPYYLAKFDACDQFTQEFIGSTLYHKYIYSSDNTYNKAINRRAGIPLFDIDATGGDIHLLDDTNESPIDYISLPNLKGRAAIIVHGDSMSPVYSDRDIITIDKNIDDNIMFGKAYLIITDNQRMIKFLLQSDNENKLLCKSANTSGYPDFEIFKNDIIKLFLIKGCIKPYDV